jgi:hypothetical protein
MDLREALQEAVTQERRLRAKRDEIDKELADLEVEVRGLRMAVERYSHAAPNQDRLPIEVSAVLMNGDLLQAPRTDAVRVVLQPATSPMRPTEIVSQLHELGRDDDYAAVSAALAYLHRVDRVHSVGRGQWVWGPSQRDRGDPEPDGTVVSGEDVPS